MTSMLETHKITRNHTCPFSSVNKRKIQQQIMFIYLCSHMFTTTEVLMFIENYLWPCIWYLNVASRYWRWLAIKCRAFIEVFTCWKSSPWSVLSSLISIIILDNGKKLHVSDFIWGHLALIVKARYKSLDLKTRAVKWTSIRGFIVVKEHYEMTSVKRRD